MSRTRRPIPCLIGRSAIITSSRRFQMLVCSARDNRGWHLIPFQVQNLWSNPGCRLVLWKNGRKRLSRTSQSARMISPAEAGAPSGTTQFDVATTSRVYRASRRIGPSHAQDFASASTGSSISPAFKTSGYKRVGILGRYPQDVPADLRLATVNA